MTGSARRNGNSRSASPLPSRVISFWASRQSGFVVELVPYCSDLEYVKAPGRQVEVEPPRHEFISVAIIGAGSGEILESQCAAGQVCKRKTQVTLALILGVVYRDQPPQVVTFLPGTGDKAV